MNETREIIEKILDPWFCNNLLLLQENLFLKKSYLDIFKYTKYRFKKIEIFTKEQQNAVKDLLLISTN